MARRPGGGVQPEERGVGVGPQADRGRQLPGRRDQLEDLLVRVACGRDPTVRIGQQVSAGAPRSADRLGVAVPREPPHHPEAIGPLGRLGLGRLGRPRQRQFRGDVVGVGVFGELDESP